MVYWGQAIVNNYGMAKVAQLNVLLVNELQFTAKNFIVQIPTFGPRKVDYLFLVYLSFRN